MCLIYASAISGAQVCAIYMGLDFDVAFDVSVGGIGRAVCGISWKLTN